MVLGSNIFFGFDHFGPVHLVVLLLIGAASWLAVIRQRKLPGEADRRRFDRVLGYTGLGIWAVNQTFEMIVDFQVERSLPLHICDFASLLAPLAILTRWRVLRAVLYYWGIGLSTQALITPELQHGLGQLQFWAFWVPHGMIILLAVYDLAALQFRPAWKDYGIAILTLAIYAAIVLPINLSLGVNYGFVGQGVPGQPSVIDFLGPWPLRVYKLAVAAAVFLAVLTLPWEIARTLQRSRQRKAEADRDRGDLTSRDRDRADSRSATATSPDRRG